MADALVGTGVEVDIARNSHLIDPQMHVWGWEIPVYLFLGGVAAGIMIFSGLLARRTVAEGRPIASGWLPLAVPVLLSAGMLALFLDLEYKLHVYRFYLAFKPTSPMSWGSWVLLAVYPASALLGLAGLAGLAAAGGPWARLRTWARAHAAGLGTANVVLGVALGVYTGLLLSGLGTARPAWNSALLGPLFLVSGASTGAAAMMLMPLSPEVHTWLRRWDLGAIAVEAVLLFLFVIGLLTGGGSAGRQVAEMLLGGAYTAPFFALVVIAGLVVPFLMEWLEGARRLAPTRVAPLLVLVGGLSLRWIVVLAGQA